jgi:Flp pilus assembly protein TadB
MNAPPINPIVTAIGSPWRALVAMVVMVATLVVMKYWPTAGMVLAPFVLVGFFLSYRWVMRRVDEVVAQEKAQTAQLRVVQEADDE